MFSLRTCAAVLCCALASSAVWADAATDRVRAGIRRHTNGQVEPTSITATPVPGIFEVVVDADVYYTDASGRYAFVDGRLVDTAKKQDLTQARLATLTDVSFDALPLDLAVKTVHGNGKRRLAIFEDPACPICRNLHGSLGQLQDVTLYTFPFPIISPDSIPAAVATLCAPTSERATKWNGFMQGATPPATVDAGCDPAKVSVGKILALGEKLRVRNTPTLILGNGKRIVGGIPVDQLAAALDEMSR